MNKMINQQLSLVYYPSELYYSGTCTTLSIQVTESLIKSMASQRLRDSVVKW